MNNNEEDCFNYSNLPYLVRTRTKRHCAHEMIIKPASRIYHD